MLGAATDAGFDDTANKAGAWASSANSWIFKNMGSAAQAHFIDPTNALSFSYNWPGQHDPSKQQLRNNWLNSLNIYIANLRDLIATRIYDPPGK